MSLFKAVAYIWRTLLAIYASCLTAAGSGIVGKGLFYCIIAKFITKFSASYHIKVSKSKENEFYGQIFMNYIIPGSVMIFLGYIIYRCSKVKLPYLFANFILVALLIASNNFGDYIKTKKLSLYAYFNRITSAFNESELLDDTVQTENMIQILVLVATVYLMFYSCFGNKRKVSI